MSVTLLPMSAGAATLGGFHGLGWTLTPNRIVFSLSPSWVLVIVFMRHQDTLRSVVVLVVQSSMAL